MPAESIPDCVVCDACQIEKPLANFARFAKTRQTNWPRHSTCRKCTAKGLHSKRYKKHRDKIIEKTKTWQRENRQKRAEWSRQYWGERKDAKAEHGKRSYEKHKTEIPLRRRQYRIDNYEKVRAAAKARRLSNPEKFRESKRRYRETHKEQCARTVREWALRHPESLQAAARRYHERHAEKRCLRSKLWRDKNPDRARQHQRKRRALEMNAPGRHTIADIDAIWKRQKKKCNVPGCLNPIADHGKNKYHIDHIKALANGGSDGPENLQILCGKCNRQKYCADEIVWANRHGLLFAL